MEDDDSLSSQTPEECSDRPVSPVNENLSVVPIVAEPEPGPVNSLTNDPAQLIEANEEQSDSSQNSNLPINDPAQLIEAIEEQSDSSQNTTLVSGISSTPILPPLAERSQWSFNTRLPANEDANEATT